MIEKQVAAKPSLVSRSYRDMVVVEPATSQRAADRGRVHVHPVRDDEAVRLSDGYAAGGSIAPLFSQMGLAGVLETFGGARLLLGLVTRSVAFVLAGEMAVAYFLVSAPLGFWTIINGGAITVLFCFLWLYLSAARAGPWRFDAWRGAEPETALPRGARASVRRAGAG